MEVSSSGAVSSRAGAHAAAIELVESGRSVAFVGEAEKHSPGGEEAGVR